MYRVRQSKIKLVKWSVAAFLMLICAFTLKAQNLPNAPNELVSDFAGVLNSGDKQRLEQKLLAYEDSTSTQIAVVLVNSTEGYDVGDYAVRLGKKWGVGGK